MKSRSSSTDKRYYGVCEAIVTDVNDPEKQGRVKVKYPWFDDHTVSGWSRVRQLYAGGGYGTFLIPEIGDEVLVAFIHGDMRLPVVLGGLYNGADMPPVHRDDSKDPKLIRTKAGHQILLDDTSGEEKIEIIDVNNNVVLIDSTGNTITIRSESDITVESTTGKLVLKGNGVEITSQGTVDVKGSAINLN